MKFKNKETGEVVDFSPCLINSALLSAQNRQRYYWANWEFGQPEDGGVSLSDILDESCTDVNSEGWHKWFAEKKDLQIKKKYSAIVNNGSTDKAICMTARQYASWNGNFAIVQKGRGNNPGGLRALDGKTPSLTSCSWQDNNHLTDGDHYRKLTPVECERLQTVLQYIKPVEIVLCSDQAKSFVSAAEKNPKLLKLVSSAESGELKEYVKRAIQSMKASEVRTKHIAPQGVDTQTEKQTRKCTNTNLSGQNLTVSNAENFIMSNKAGSAESSVIQSAFINITEGKITHYGKEESPQIEQSYTERMNGKIALSLFGGEMVRNAKDVLSVLEMIQTNRHSTSITSFRLSTKNLEQMLIISYWFAKSVIDGFTQDTTQKKSLYLGLIDGYTNHVSNTQRYKMLGNGWTVDVIAHIFKSM